MEWPIGGLELAPGRKIGTSNRTDSGQVRLQMVAPGMLLLLPRDQLEGLMRGLLAAGPAHGLWPAL